MLLAASTAVVGLTPHHNALVPSVAVASAKKSALVLLIRPRTSGRLRVRDIRASYAGSRSMFNAFALALVRKVPVVRKRSVRVDREGVEVAAEERREGTG